LKILEIAKKYKIPILADEVYFGIVYPGKEYIPFANLDKDVPIIVILLLKFYKYFIEYQLSFKDLPLTRVEIRLGYCL